jgi:translation initiation factor 1
MKHNRSDYSRPVYSSEQGRLCPDCGAARNHCRCRQQPAAAAPEGDGIVRIRRQSKGRGGKTVTLIEGLPDDAAALRERATRLKRHCGVGGAVREHCIEIQGDQRERLAVLLRAEGFTVKLAGG